MIVSWIICDDAFAVRNYMFFKNGTHAAKNIYITIHIERPWTLTGATESRSQFFLYLRKYVARVGVKLLRHVHTMLLAGTVWRSTCLLCGKFRGEDGFVWKLMQTQNKQSLNYSLWRWQHFIYKSFSYESKAFN